MLESADVVEIFLPFSTVEVFLTLATSSSAGSGKRGRDLFSRFSIFELFSAPLSTSSMAAVESDFASEVTEGLLEFDSLAAVESDFASEVTECLLEFDSSGLSVRTSLSTCCSGCSGCCSGEGDFDKRILEILFSMIGEGILRFLKINYFDLDNWFNHRPLYLGQTCLYRPSPGVCYLYRQY